MRGVFSVPNLEAVTYWSEWSGRPDLNRGPLAPKASALPGCATPRKSYRQAEGRKDTKERQGIG